MLGEPVLDLGDLSARRELRKNLQCRDFKWFLNNVWPESDVRLLPDDVPYMGTSLSFRLFDERKRLTLFFPLALEILIIRATKKC